MAMEIPLDLINQLQISLRKEAQIPSFNPNDSSLLNIESLSDSIAEGDPSPPDHRCNHCKGKLLRGAKSVICVYCGRKKTTEGSPEPINFKSSSGCRWFLQSLDLEGSEIIAPQDASPLSDILKLQVRWHAEAEKLEASISEEDYFFPRKSSLRSNEANANDESFFPERSVVDAVLATPEGESTIKKDSDVDESDDFQDLRSPGLVENVQSSVAVLSSVEEKSGGSFTTGWQADFQGADSGTPHEVSKPFDPFVSSVKAPSENLSTVVAGNDLFDAKEEGNIASVSSTDNKDGKFDSSDGWDEFKGSVGVEDPSSASREISASDVKSVEIEEKGGDTFSGLETGLQSTTIKSQPEESGSFDPFVGSPVDVSAHIDDVFGSGKDLFDGKTNAEANSSASNSNSWFQDDLWSKSTLQTAEKSDVTVMADDGIVEYPNSSSDKNVDGSSKAAGDTRDSQDYDSFGDWDDFKGSATMADTSTSPSKQVSSAKGRIGDTFSGWDSGFQSTNASSHHGRSKSFDPFLGSSPDLSFQMDSIFGSGKEKNTTPSASITSNWLEGDLWSSNTTSTVKDSRTVETSSNEAPVKKIDDDFFDSWNAFKSSATAEKAANPVTMNSEAENLDIKDGGTPKNEDVSSALDIDWNLSNTKTADSKNPDENKDPFDKLFNIDSFPNANLFSGGISNQDVPGEASLSNRMDDASKDAEVPGTSSRAKSSDLDTVMSQMHDLSFMLDNDLSLPPKSS